MHRSSEELRKPSGVEVDPVRVGLVRKVRGHHDREAKIATGEDEWQVHGEVAGIHDRENGIGTRLQQKSPERRQALALVRQGVGSGKVHEHGIAAADVTVRRRV
jgi:hypothetical protein